MTKKPQIFLSYAREDEKQVKELYQKLTDAGFNPWLDKENILPGQNWAYCITKAIQESDFVLVCLSANSINKRGFLQKEIERALDIRKEKLESDIYLIPVRFEDCKPPDRLQAYQWVDLFEPDGWARLAKAIQEGTKQLIPDTESQTRPSISFESQSVDIWPPSATSTKRPLHFIWIVDCSATMSVDGKIEALNNAIREAIPHLQNVARKNPHAEVLLRAVKFSRGAEWHVAQPTSVEQFQWQDLDVDDGPYRDMGRALKMVAQQLKIPPMPAHGLPPVLVLVTDGSPTDDFKSGLEVLMNEPWGKKAVRLGIAIGKDADHKCLRQFIGNSELQPLQANNADALVTYIKWASTEIIPVPNLIVW